MQQMLKHAILGALLLCTLPPTQAQTPPKLIAGHPNLNGIWQALNTANWDLQEHPSRPGLIPSLGAAAAEPGGPGVVENEDIPYLPEARAKRAANFKNRLTLDPEIRCYLPGIPRANYQPHPFQILQNDKAIFFAYQFAGAVRNIFLKDPGPAPADSWMGQSVGHWEGQTLVISVTDLDERTWFDRAGNHHSDALRVTERFTLLSPEILDYQATIEDPKTFSRPWKIRMPLYKHVEKNARLAEFKCVEFAEDLMYGEFNKSK
jgi:hypothetical protein